MKKENKTLRLQMKIEALKRMSALQLLPEVRKDFERNNKVYYSERQNSFFNAILYWADNDLKISNAIKSFEEKYEETLVYHAQLSHTNMGDLLTLFFITNNPEEWENERKDLKRGYTFAYVENLDVEFASDFGDVGIKPSQGGVLRTA